MRGDVYYGFQELKREVGNNCNKMANDFDCLADMAETETDEIFFESVAKFLRQIADENLFAKDPPKYDGNVVDFEEYYQGRRG